MGIVNQGPARRGALLACRRWAWVGMVAGLLGAPQPVVAQEMLDDYDLNLEFDSLEADAFATDQPTEPTGPATTGPATTGPGPTGQLPAPPPTGPEPLPPNFYQPGTVPPPDTLNPPPTSGRVPAQPAVNRSSPSLQGGFQVRLARAPKMMGDLFGNGFAPATGRMFFGRAVHHVTGTISGINDIHTIDETSSPVTYGSTFFSPLITPPAPALIEGLSSSSGGEFVAELTGDTVDVFDFGTSGLELDISDAPVYNIFEIIGMDLPAAGPADIIGRTRLNDNNSAMPQDRIYFDYSYFHNAALTSNGVNVNRWAPGAEKTFFDGIASVEVRVPMGVSLSSDLVSGVAPDVSQYEFGNVTIAPKILLSSDDELAIAVGMGVSLPTADDIRLRMTNGVDVLRIENEAVHLLPYFAMLYTPRNSSCFAHGFLTYDFDTGGNTTYANLTGAGLEEIGSWDDQHLVSLNLGLGSWLYQAGNPYDRLQGVAVTGEVHYTASMNEADVVRGGTFQVGAPGADLDVLNGTFGGHVRIGKTIFTTGYSTPLNSDERVFDGELRVFVNRLF